MLKYQTHHIQTDIDYSETIEYLIQQPTDKEIKEFLIEKAIDVFYLDSYWD